MRRTVTEPVGVRKLTVKAAPEQVREARSFTRARLARFGCDPEAIDDAELIISELVTNAIDSAPGAEIEITVFPITEYVALCVRDPANALPRRRRPRLMDENGRGIAIVERYAFRHGVLAGRSGGKIVWAVVRKRSGGS